MNGVLDVPVLGFGFHNHPPLQKLASEVFGVPMRNVGHADLYINSGKLVTISGLDPFDFDMELFARNVVSMLPQELLEARSLLSEKPFGGMPSYRQLGTSLVYTSVDLNKNRPLIIKTQIDFEKNSVRCLHSRGLLRPLWKIIDIKKLGLTADYTIAEIDNLNVIAYKELEGKFSIDDWNR